jgi:hypothetical protein
VDLSSIEAEPDDEMLLDRERFKDNEGWAV